MIKLYNSDALALLHAKDWRGKFDAIITDPPYCINYKKWDGALFDLLESLELMTHTLKNNGNFIIFAGWSNVCKIKSYMERIGFVLKNWIIWDRVKCKNPGNNLTSVREDILWFIKEDNEKLIFNKMDSTIKKKTKGYGSKNGSEYRRLSNVWTDIAPVSYMSHEYQGNDCQKPVELMKRCVQLWTNENYTVFDPFMGSCATGVACEELNRDFVGNDNNKDCFYKAKKRLKMIEQDDNL